MTRLLINEVANFLGKKRSWVYQNLYRLEKGSVKVFVDEAVLARLIKQAFLSGSYERYPYDLLADAKLVKRLRAGAMLADFYSHAKKIEELFELVFAAKMVSDLTVFNLLSYVLRKTAFHDNRGDFKKYAFGKLVRECCCEGKQLHLAPLLGGKENKLAKAPVSVETLRTELLSLV
jgi:hypothetical protein